LLHVPFDGDGPRPRAQRVRVAVRILLLEAELVEVVVRRDRLVGGELLFVPSRRARPRQLRADQQLGVQRRRRRAHRQRAHEASPVQVHGFRRHLGGGDVVGALDEHGGAPWLADSTEWRTVPKPAVAADGSLEWAWARAGARRRLRPYYTDDSHTARASDRGAFPDSCLPPGTGCRVRRTDRQPRACPLSGPS